MTTEKVHCGYKRGEDVYDKAREASCPPGADLKNWCTVPGQPVLDEQGQPVPVHEDRVPHGERLYAFRCKRCGHLHEAGHAGDNELPHACCVCGNGVRHGPDFEDIAARLLKGGADPEERKRLAAEVAAAKNNLTKTLQPSNWEVLADCSPERLKECGLAAEHVEKHVPAKGGPFKDKPQAVFASAVEGAAAKGVVTSETA